MKIMRCENCGNSWSNECPSCTDGCNEATCPACGGETRVARDTDEPLGLGAQMGPGTPGAGELPWKKAEGAIRCPACGTVPWRMEMVHELDRPDEFVVFGCVACPKCGASVWGPGVRVPEGATVLDPYGLEASGKALAMWNATTAASEVVALAIGMDRFNRLPIVACACCGVVGQWTNSVEDAIDPDEETPAEIVEMADAGTQPAMSNVESVAIMPPPIALSPVAPTPGVDPSA